MAVLGVFVLPGAATGQSTQLRRTNSSATAKAAQNRTIRPIKPSPPHPRTPAPSQYWAVTPVRRPPLPAIKNAAWCVTPIDRFILAALEKQGMRPAPPADRRTLLRRVTYDLTGLPPTPSEIANFLADRSPKAYEKVVDRLLASPRYGERWARHWLDVAHYGDTHGYDKDKRRDHAWPYRDYVIRALNEDRPYSRFVQEQVAGDVLFPNAANGVIAAGFLSAGPWDFVGNVELSEGTVEKEKTRVLDRDDMVSNVMATFNSVTIHCARCHNHKFDPIPQKDYYRLQAVFAGVERGDRPYGDPQAMAERSAMDRRERDLKATQAELQRAVAALASPEVVRLDQQIAALRQQQAALPPLPAAAASLSNGYHSAIESRPDVEKWVQIDLGKSLPIDRIRLIPARPTDFADTPGFGFPVRYRVTVSDDPKFGRCDTVYDGSGTAVPNPGDLPVVFAPDGQRARYVRVTALTLWKRTNDYVFALAELQVESGGRNAARGAAVTALDSIEGGRWSTRYLVDDFNSRARLADTSDAKTAAIEEQRAEIDRKLQAAIADRVTLQDALIDPPTRAGLLEAGAGLKELAEKRAKLAKAERVFSVLPRAPRPVHILARGEVEKPGEPVGPGALSCLAALPSVFDIPAAAPEGDRRAALARWLSSPANALTWRSIVNRVWGYHFGRAIVDTPNDFGRNGSRPSHPELLDWLAVNFLAKPEENTSHIDDAQVRLHPHLPATRKSLPLSRRAERGNSGRGGWGVRAHLQTAATSTVENPWACGQSLKRLHRLIVLSAAYRQSSRDNAAYAAHDGDNRLLWRMNRQRLDAEQVRDSVLAISGKLDLKMGGPGFDLFRFKDDHSPVYDYTAPGIADRPETWRRAVYAFSVRSVQNPFIECLDGADPNLATPVRSTTLTSLQALALLNDPFILRQSALFAERLEREHPNLAAQISAAYELAFARPPSAAEQAELSQFAASHGLAAACRLLFNTSEFLFVD